MFIAFAASHGLYSNHAQHSKQTKEMFLYCYNDQFTITALNYDICPNHTWTFEYSFFHAHRGNLAYESNYCAGLRILDISGIKANPPDIKEVGYFDVSPDCDTPGYVMGTWSNYPYFESGTIVVSSIERGLFVLKYTGPQWTCYCMLCDVFSIISVKYSIHCTVVWISCSHTIVNV